MGGFDSAYADRQNVVKSMSAKVPLFQTNMEAAKARGMINNAEFRVKNDRTGGEKGTKQEKFSLLPWPELSEVARLYAFGSSKYLPRNWESGYNYSLSFDALMRHASSWWMGEEIDPESQCSHMAAVAFHAFALMRFAEQYPELDDRPGSNNAEVQSL